MSAVVIRHPSGAHVPIVNPSWRGRYPPQVVLLRRVRGRLEAQRRGQLDDARQRLEALQSARDALRASLSPEAFEADPLVYQLRVLIFDAIARVADLERLR